MTFANPNYLIPGSLILLGAIFFTFWANRQQKRALAKLGDQTLVQRLSANINWRGRRWRTLLWLFALAMVIIALARPQWGSEVREVQQEGLQVMVALDVSQSMLAEDVKPSRLARAKLEITDLTERLDGDEIGLVLFSGASFIQVPLTSDYLTALNYLDNAGPGLISRPGTVIGEAIQTAVNGFDPSLNSQKVLILMTDGEDSETDPLAAAQEAADQQVKIYTIGFGDTEGQPIPETNSLGEPVGYKKDRNGQVVLSKLDEKTLQLIAETGNGRYYRASADGSELGNLLAEIDNLQQAQLETRFETRFIERFQLFLGLALLALLVSEVIPDRLAEHSSKFSSLSSWRKRRSRQTVLNSQ
jgi:Ca-activated chloride channel family protein